jgi:type IV pilus assembly protein PilB
LRALDEIRFQTGLAVDPIVVEQPKLAPLVNKYAESASDALKNLTNDDINLDFLDEDTAAKADEAAGQDIDDAPVVKFIQKVLIDAINEGASDIHFEPYEKYYRIRFRTDGILRDIATAAAGLKEKIAARIKVISRLDISEKRVPQDGRMKLVLSKNKAIDFRVSTLPTLHGEKIVMRILDPSSAMLGIDALGYEPDQKATLLDAISRPYGMMLVTGPTGSGKTVSLYTCLNILNKPASTSPPPKTRPKSTCRHQPGQRQRKGRPDLLGRTARLPAPGSGRHHGGRNPRPGNRRDLHQGRPDRPPGAVHPAHQRRALDARTPQEHGRGAVQHRILGDPDHRPAPRTPAVLLQKADGHPPPGAARDAGYSPSDLDGSWQLYGPRGCERCKGSGYKGRVGIYQVMPISEEIARIIMTAATRWTSPPRPSAKACSTCASPGLRKVKQGVTSLEEVLARPTNKGRSISWPLQAAKGACHRPKEDLYIWEGKDKTGKVVRGEIRATGDAVVQAMLRRQGIQVTKVRSRRWRAAGASPTRTSRCSPASWPP